MTSGRRDSTRRAVVFQKIVQNVVNNPASQFTLQRFRELIGVPEAAARGIIARLVSAGLIAEVERGVWARTWSSLHS